MMGEARAKSNGFRPCTRHVAWGCPEYVCVIERAGPVLSDVPSKELLGKVCMMCTRGWICADTMHRSGTAPTRSAWTKSD